MKYYEDKIYSEAYYQMIAYCHRFGLDTGMIICANGDQKKLAYESESRDSLTLNHKMVSVEPVKLFTENEVNAKELMEAMKENLNELMRKIAVQANKDGQPQPRS